MRMTDKLLAELNALRGLKYEDPGYSYFADVFGSGVYSPHVYATLPGGGVTYSELNGATARERCKKIRAAIDKARTKAEPQQRRMK